MAVDEILRFLHSWNRWLLLIVMGGTFVYFLRGWLTSQPWTKQGQTLLTIFSSLVGLQWLLGLIFIITLGSVMGFGVRHYWEHLVIQTIALGLAHMHMSWRKREYDDKTRYQRGVFLITGVTLVMIIGIMVLPSGIQWQFAGL